MKSFPYATKLGRLPRPVLALLGLLLVLVVGCVDLVTGWEISFSIFYLAPISLVAWFAGLRLGLMVALASAAVWLIADLESGALYSNWLVPWWNATVRLAFFVAFVPLLTAVKRLNQNLERRVEEKSAQLALEATARQKVEQQVVEISAQQQRRVAHDLHDGLCQYLTGIAFKAKLLEEILTEQQAEPARGAREIVGLLNNAIAQAHRLAKGLDPVDLDRNGLLSALHTLAAETENQFLVQVDFLTRLEDLRLPQPTALHLYRIAQQAVANGIRHGQAQRIDIELGEHDGLLRLQVTDHGIGFVPGTQGNGGMGIHIMHYRARSIGGTLKMTSRLNEGTIVECLIPYPDQNPPAPGEIQSDRSLNPDETQR